MKQFTVGFLLVLRFGIGLAITMVSAGVLAALSLRQVERRWGGFSRFAYSAPYVSAALIVLIGVYTGWLGLHEIVSGLETPNGIDFQRPICTVGSQQASAVRG